MIKYLQEVEVINATQISIKRIKRYLGEHLAHSTYVNKLILCVLRLTFRKQTSRKISEFLKAHQIFHRSINDCDRGSAPQFFFFALKTPFQNQYI